MEAHRPTRLRRFATSPLGDLLLALALGGVGVLELARGVRYEGLPVFPGSAVANAVAIAVIVLGLVLRRARPWYGLALVLGAIVVQSLTVGGSEATFVFLAFLVAVYSATSATGAVATVTCAALATMLVHGIYDPAFRGLGDVVFSVGLVVVAVGLGAAVRRRATRIAHLEARAGTLLDAQDQVARRAVQDERDRIARELHDIIAHSLGVMVVQAEGGIATLGDREPAASEAFERISTTGRDALVEMRSMLGVLRDEGEESPAPRTPQPGLSSIPELVARAADSGLDVRLSIEGEERPLPPGLAITAYRIVQEGLTNARKHAVRGTRVEVRIRLATSRLDIEIGNEAAGDSPAGSQVPGAGRGLAGMRERVELHGGVLTARREDEGRRFQLVARIPVPEAVA